MRWMSMYLIGYVLVVAGIIAALWKVGVLERIGGFWLGIGLLIAVGIGIIMAVSGSGTKQTIEVDRR
jgi:hypothetical protein